MAGDAHLVEERRVAVAVFAGELIGVEIGVCKGLARSGRAPLFLVSGVWNGFRNIALPAAVAPFGVVFDQGFSSAKRSSEV